MSFEKSCEFYENSKCLLNSSYCDLNCGRLSSQEEFGFYEKSSPVNKWENEELDKEIQRVELRLR